MSITTTAAVVEHAGAPFALSQVTLDEPQAGEVLVRMVAAGLCHTDLTVQAGYAPFPLPGILGHEGAGIVEAVGSAVGSVKPGDHVVLSFTSCGDCAQCLTGHPAYCATWVPRNLFNGGVRPDGTATASRDGASIGGNFFGQSSFAAHAIVQQRCLVKVDTAVPLHLLAPLGCGVQTGAGTVINILKPALGATLAVFGTGAVGLSAVMAAALYPLGAVIAIDRVTSRLELAKELGATHTVNAEAEDVAAALAEITGGAGLDFAVDTTANMAVLRTATDSLGTFGTCAVVGAAPPGTELNADASGILVGRTIVGVTEGDSNPAVFIPELVELYRSGRLPLDKIVKKYAFAELDQAAHDIHDGTAIKPVVTFDAA